MKTRDRPNFSKKLVKTTTISVALLVAAIMIISAIPSIATPVTTTKMNKLENTEMKGDPTGLDPKLAEKRAAFSLNQGSDFQPVQEPLADIMHGYVAYGGSSGEPEGPCYYPL
jgi:hypothetical protein